MSTRGMLRAQRVPRPHLRAPARGGLAPRPEELAVGLLAVIVAVTVILVVLGLQG